MLPNVINETNKLKLVVLGIANDFGGTPHIDATYDPKSREHVIAGTFPKEEDLIREMEGFRKVLESHGVEVLRPENQKGVHQVFSRDIGFVIDNIYVVPNIIEDRHEESHAALKIAELFPKENVLIAPTSTRIEGGDVMPWDDKIFVGYSESEDFEKYKVSRTNRAGIDFLQKHFPEREVIGFELNKSDTDALNNALHLDCCFQPIGTHQAIIYKGGFKNEADYQYLVNYFGKENLIEITQEEMYNMYSNIFSISPEVIVSGASFTRLNEELRQRGYTVEEVEYDQVAKMEGLLRCSTMPLIRE